MMTSKLGRYGTIGLVTVCLLVASSIAMAAEITGAGATFPYPVYSK